MVGVPTILADKSAIVGGGTFVPQKRFPLSIKTGVGNAATVKIVVGKAIPVIPQVVVDEIKSLMVTVVTPLVVISVPGIVNVAEPLVNVTEIVVVAEFAPDKIYVIE